jgi:hypothetical protein
MLTEDYRRIGKALLEIALQQRNVSDGARWLAVARACKDLEAELTSAGQTPLRLNSPEANSPKSVRKVAAPPLAPPR